MLSAGQGEAAKVAHGQLAPGALGSSHCPRGHMPRPGPALPVVLGQAVRGQQQRERSRSSPAAES